MTGHILAGGTWLVDDHSQHTKASTGAIQYASLFAAFVRDPSDSNDSRLIVKVGSTGVFQSTNGKQLIGEVVNVNSVLGSYIVNEYALWIPGESESLPFTRFDLHGDSNGTSSLYHICEQDDDGGNLIMTKQNAITTIRENEGLSVGLL
ncbi:unnamed protein product [Mucor fragilis]